MDYVLGKLKKGSGTQFDSRLVDIFLKLIDDGAIDPMKSLETVKSHSVIRKVYEQSNDKKGEYKR